MTDDGRIGVLLRGMMETFGVSPTPGQIIGYRMGLEGLSPDDIERAIGQAMRTLKFMPKPAELRELAGELTPATRAVMAWGVVKKTIHRLSAYDCPDFDDPVVNATIRNMGGWVELCGRDADTFETFTRRDFERIYTHLAAKAHLLGPDATDYLKGIFDQPPKRVAVGLPPLAGATKAVEGTNGHSPRELPASAKPGASGSASGGR